VVLVARIFPKKKLRRLGFIQREMAKIKGESVDIGLLSR
jgi:hypothetical protein